MPITQIPFQDPVAPPEKPQPEQLGLYDTQEWETAYRDLDAHVPHLLIQLQDDLERSRWREAIWISIIVHLVLTIVLWNFNLIEKYVGWHTAVVVPMATQDKNLTFLALPPDLQKPTRRPNTNIASDKDRIATSRHPELDPKELRKILATPPPGAPGMNGPRAPGRNRRPPPHPAPQSQGAEPAAFSAAATGTTDGSSAVPDQSAGTVADARSAQQLIQQICGRDDCGPSDSASRARGGSEPWRRRWSGRRFWPGHGSTRPPVGCARHFERHAGSGFRSLPATHSAGRQGKLVPPDSGVRRDEEGEARD